MLYGITLLANRVAPRCTHADSIMMIEQHRDRIKAEKKLEMTQGSLQNLCDLLLQNHIDTLICGGITRENKKFLQSKKLDIIDNVVCTADEIIRALRLGKLRPGFGLEFKDPETVSESDTSEVEIYPAEEAGPVADCLACSERQCLRGEACPVFGGQAESFIPVDSETSGMLEASADIACERERTLCRLSELIYFCLEMGYSRLGVAYCTDLEEPAETLVRVLRRFFAVFPICCKAGGGSRDQSEPHNHAESEVEGNPGFHCNPMYQAKILNYLKTDLNVMVGICMGADCVFTRESEAPVSTLFVKDKSLANNPIGAIYSDYYLKEAIQTDTARRTRNED